jgi:cobalt-precorrin-7 (C5)-methyltransferase
MIIVGVGAGPELLTERAIYAIETARSVYGSKRAIELAKKHIKCNAQEITDYSLVSLPEDAVVISTGDPMLSGLGKFAKNESEIIPGISSLQLACSRLCVDIETISVITAHSRDIDKVKAQLILELKLGKNVFLLPDPSFGVHEVAEFLKSESIRRNISICERLAYPDERISSGTVEEPPPVDSNLYCIMITI